MFNETGSSLALHLSLHDFVFCDDVHSALSDSAPFRNVIQHNLLHVVDRRLLNLQGSNPRAATAIVNARATLLRYLLVIRPDMSYKHGKYLMWHYATFQAPPSHSAGRSRTAE